MSIKCIDVFPTTMPLRDNGKLLFPLSKQSAPPRLVKLLTHQIFATIKGLPSLKNKTWTGNGVDPVST